MTQHSEGPGDRPGEHGVEDDYGPPEWFAAVAAPGWEPVPEPAPAPEPFKLPTEQGRWGAAGSGRQVAAEAAAAGGGAGGETGAAAGSDVTGLGLVAASELPAGRRRRRSALWEESDAEGEALHAGAAAQAAPPKRRTARERADDRGSEQGDRQRSDRPRGDRTRGDRPRGGRARGRAAEDGAAAPEEQVDPETRARDVCLRLLTGAAKTRKQLADALRKREIPAEVAERVLDRLEEVGLIDDAAFAAAWVESRHAVRGLSRRALAQELRTRGVTGEAVERALLQVDYEDESEAARALVERKLRTTRGLERQARTRRLVGVLARRGYSEGLAFRVVREALDAEGRDAADEDDGPEAYGAPYGQGD